MRGTQTLGLLGLAMILTACGGSDEQLAQGQAVYEAECAACHGLRGEGEANWQQAGADGVMPAPPHDGSGHTWHHPDPQLLAIIANGGGTPGSRMPAFEGKLTQQEMESVLAYIKSFWSAEQRAAQADITRRAPE